MQILWNSAYPGIYIDDSVGSKGGRGLGFMEGAAFVSATRRTLTKIASQPVGADLLSLISKRCQGIGTKLKDGRCTIFYGVGTLTEGQVDFGNAVMTQTFAGGTDPVGRNRTRDGIKVSGVVLNGVYKAGIGSSAIVSYNPFGDIDGVVLGGRTLLSIIGVTTPAYVALAHELVHAFHTLSGDRNPDRPAGKAPLEEARTVGAGKYADNRLCENAIRRENSLPLRQWYSQPGDCA